MLAATLAGAAGAGYAAGRVRPLDRLDTWVWRQFTFYGPWLVGSKPRQAVLIAAHVLVRPAVSWNAWRHRNDPPPGRAPAPEFDPQRAEHRTAPQPATDDAEERPA